VKLKKLLTMIMRMRITFRHGKWSGD
jgi:hypothetical protein